MINTAISAKARRSHPASAAATMFTVLSMITLAACSDSDTSSQAAKNVGCGDGQTITVNLPEEPTSLDGNYDTLVVPAQINQNLYDGLFTMDKDLKITPNLATGYKQVDPKTYRVDLRDVKFHDGTPFTSADVVNSFDRITNDTTLASKQTSYVSNVANVKADGAHSVIFTLKQPDSSFIGALASLLFMTPKAAIEKEGNATFATKPVGTGPFKFVEWVKGDHLTMQANCDYWQGPPKVSKVVWKFVSDPATAIASLQSGQTDLAPFVSPDQAKPLRGDDRYAVKTVQGNRNIWVMMNSFAGPTKDVRVRQALNYAIDKDALTSDLLKGGGVPSGQPANKNVFGFDPSIAPYPHDPEKAKQLLSEAGYASGLKLTFINDRAVQNLAWQAVGDQLKAVGIDVTLKNDANYFPNTFLKKKMPANTLYIQGCSNQVLDADYCLGLTFDSKRRGLYYNSPATDKLIADGRAEPDRAKRQQIYNELMQKLHDQAPVIFLYANIDTYVMTSGLSFTPRGDQKIWLWDVDKAKG